MIDRTKGGVCLLAVALLLSASAAGAQDSDETTYEVSVYLWGEAVSGELAGRNASAEVDASFSDILDVLNVGLMGSFQARRDRWLLLLDGQYIVLEDETDTRTITVDPGPGPGVTASVRAKAELEQAFADLKLGYALIDAPLPGESGSDPRSYGVDFLLGARWWYMKPDIDVRIGPLAGSYENSASWVDGLVGLRAHVDLTRTLRLVALGDVGGFSIGDASDTTFQAMVGLRWQTGSSWSTHLGYRVLHVDRPVGDAGNFDIRFRGPQLGVAFAF
jgi:hypothetical protein